MERINRIVLDTTLPVVFAGAENDEPVASSGVWLRKLSFDRPAKYLVEAESGTGKSSLCAYIYGNRRDYTGSIFFNDTDIRSFSIADWCEIRRRHLAYLPQEMRLFPELTAMENIKMKNRLTDRFTEAEILDMLDRLEIRHKAGVVGGRLSVGQQQRVAIIRALAQPFDFILLDEPVSHLDQRNNLTVARLILDMALKNDAAIITTSVGNALRLADIPETEGVKSVKL